MAACRITFIGHKFTDIELGDRELIMTVDVDDGDYQAVLVKVMNEGGIFIPDADSDRKWFMPWPPCVVAIDPIY